MGTNSELAKQPLSLPRGMRKIHPYQGSPKIHELESKQEQIVPSLSCTWGEKGTEEILSTSNVRAPFFPFPLSANLLFPFEDFLPRCAVFALIHLTLWKERETRSLRHLLCALSLLNFESKFSARVDPSPLLIFPVSAFKKSPHPPFHDGERDMVENRHRRVSGPAAGGERLPFYMTL